MVERDSLVALNIHFLRQGIKLLSDIDDTLYLNEESPHHKSAVGKHMRHILEHYLSLLGNANGRLDYDSRARDERIENNRLHAVTKAKQIIEKLKKHAADQRFLDKRLKVKNNEGDPNSWSVSSVQRELQFLVSHTVHHYSLIAIILRIQGYKPDEEFGVAPSTLRYQKQVSNKATG
ncbi:hypothetical protein NC796_10770 [Aliifodinibius sp. S!AR15-10]|uniref:hypothetical protein n=1 Tax=Aliifodinibius sp. S!AR15-10 TaxID=2950437 RepID=UPI00285E35D5|nr:hypothetical protein [Aliifodinibius sp. S!AR15-10]MDR8391626.1 hypothetical protein [Aliifodinibius sp. S!AR15-10]